MSSHRNKTYSEIKQDIESSGISFNNFVIESLNSYHYTALSLTDDERIAYNKMIKKYPLNMVQDNSSYTPINRCGDGEFICKFDEHLVFVKLPYFSDSYDGYDFYDDAIEVNAIRKIIPPKTIKGRIVTEFEEVKIVDSEDNNIEDSDIIEE